eukprot:g7533.t1
MSISADEVVALGAAVQAAMIFGEVKDIMLIDVTPLTLGVETDGERPLAKDNKKLWLWNLLKLGMFRLDGIPVAPKGVPKIEVSFDVNVEGILTDSASLEDAEVQRILDEAEEKWTEACSELACVQLLSVAQRARSDQTCRAKEDEEAKFQLELRYAASKLLEQTDQNLLELGETDGFHETGESSCRILLAPKMEEVKVCLKDGEEPDYFQLMDAVDSLRFELMKLGLRVYGKQVAPDGAPGPAKPRSPGADPGLWGPWWSLLGDTDVLPTTLRPRSKEYADEDLGRLCRKQWS